MTRYKYEFCTERTMWHLAHFSSECWRETLTVNLMLVLKLNQLRFGKVVRLTVYIILCPPLLLLSPRTNTVVLIDTAGAVTFVERTMRNCDPSQWSSSRFQFQLQAWSPRRAVRRALSPLARLCLPVLPLPITTTTTDTTSSSPTVPAAMWPGNALQGSFLFGFWMN